ncbi:MAG TPA: hypothetical protein PLY89_04180, partial [Synergistaceae bacterium]|nr:hypothetical protein [Synergistaceae bacterium]
IALFLWQSGALALPPPSDAALEQEVERLSQALALREEGETLLRGGDKAGALERFRRSLALFPDRALELRIQKLAEELDAGGPGAGTSPPPMPTPPTQPTQPPMPPRPTRGEVVLQKTLSQDGGTLVVAGNLSIALDPGALSGEVPFSLRPARVAPLPLVGGSSLPLEGVWDVDAGGASFSSPARISLDLPREARRDDVLLVRPVFSRSGVNWTPLPYQRRGDTLLFEAPHFSFTGMVLIALLAPLIPVAFVYFHGGEQWPDSTLFNAEAPFVADLIPDPAGFHIAWTHLLGDGKDGVRDPAGLAAAEQAAKDRFIASQSAIFQDRDRALASPKLPEVERLKALMEADRRMDGARSDLEKDLAKAKEDYLVPEEVKLIREGLVFGRSYLLSRGFSSPDVLDVFVPRHCGKDDGTLNNRYWGRNYMMVGASLDRDDIFSTTMHEQFHHFQGQYLKAGKANIYLAEASAALMEREAADHYRQHAGVTIFSDNRFLNGLKEGLNGKPIKTYEGDAGPFQRLGYGLSWFLEYLRDQWAKQPGNLSEDFHKKFLVQCQALGGSPTPVEAFSWGAGGSRSALGKVFASFVREAVLEGLPSHTLYEKKYGIPLFDGTLGDVHDPLSFDAQAVQEITDAMVKPWSLQFFRLAPPKTLSGEPMPRLVLFFPAEWFDASSTAGRQIFLRMRSGDGALSLDTPPGKDYAGVVSFDATRYLYVVDTGQTGSGYWYDYKPGMLVCLEAPQKLTASLRNKTLEIVWQEPRLAKERPELVTGYRIQVRRLTEKIPRVDRTVPRGSPRLTLGEADGVGSFENLEVSARTVMTLGDRRDESEPAMALATPESSKIFPLFENRTYWTTATPLGNDPGVVFPPVPLAVSVTLGGVTGSMGPEAPEWKAYLKLAENVAGTDAFLKKKFEAELASKGITLTEEQMRQALQSMQVAGVFMPEESSQKRTLLGGGWRAPGASVAVTLQVTLPPVPRIPLSLPGPDGNPRPLEAQVEVSRWFMMVGPQKSPEFPLGSGTLSWTPKSASEDAFGIDLALPFSLTFFDPATGEVLKEGGVPLKYENFNAIFPLGVFFCPEKKP